MNVSGRTVTQSPPFAGTNQSLTIGQYLSYLSPKLARQRTAPIWPPDIFAVAASILQKCGAYIQVVSDWPPGRQYRRNPKRWVIDIRRSGKQWREAAIHSRRPPRMVTTWWTCVLNHQKLRLDDVHKERRVCHALLQLCAAADEASIGAGIPNKKAKDDAFQLAVRRHLALQGMQGSTLCKTIDRSKLCVLPKLHTPQSGITIRSVSHHLAICPSGDVETYWFRLPRRPEAHCLNLLLIPWPEITTPNHFRMSKGRLRNMPANYGFFTHDRPFMCPRHLCDLAKDLFRQASELVGQIDGVILPELALNRNEHSCLRDAMMEQGAFLLSGIREPPSGKEPGRNCLAFDLPFLHLKLYKTSYEQPKHHRWLLDKRQIVQYGLGGALDPRQSWWECMGLEPRKLAFFAMRPWLTLCALICEDLARQDPVAEIVRAVGPNLIVALLMDGPQLPSRWSARYATVLADDPGSSVLTLTSIGMAKLSRPPHTGTPSRVVGLWKDARTGDPVPIELPPNAEAIVLSLVAEDKEEWTADGRTDRGGSGMPVFGGVHPVFRSRGFGK